jgi:hypothetical protein
MDIGSWPTRKNISTDSCCAVKMLEYIALGIPEAAPRSRRSLVLQRRHDLIFEPETWSPRRGDRGPRPVAVKGESNRARKAGVLRQIRLGKKKITIC